MLSVVIPTYRKPAQLERTLHAIAEALRSFDGPCEVVVVDDGSKDATTDVLRRFATTTPLVEAGAGRNEGRAKARNRGWRAASGDWVLFLDDDIVLEPGALAAHAAAQTQQPAVYLGDVVTALEVVDSTLFDYLDTRGVAKHPPGARVPSRYLLTQNVSIPRDALERVGGFDERFGAYGFEDMELAFRIEDVTGLAFFHLAGARGYHIHHHTLEEYLHKKEICGRETLPLLAQLHPHRMAEMQLDVLAGLGQVDSTSRRLLAAGLTLSFRAGLPTLVLALVQRWPLRLGRAARHRAYDYLVMSCYARGLDARHTANS
jgi:glycosyltransferase involved in cell wall biosynthesis